MAGAHRFVLACTARRRAVQTSAETPSGRREGAPSGLPALSLRRGALHRRPLRPCDASSRPADGDAARTRMRQGERARPSAASRSPAWSAACVRRPRRAHAARRHSRDDRRRQARRHPAVVRRIAPAPAADRLRRLPKTRLRRAAARERSRRRWDGSAPASVRTDARRAVPRRNAARTPTLQAPRAAKRRDPGADVPGKRACARGGRARRHPRLLAADRMDKPPVDPCVPSRFPEPSLSRTARGGAGSAPPARVKRPQRTRPRERRRPPGVAVLPPPTLRNRPSSAPPEPPSLAAARTDGSGAPQTRRLATWRARRAARPRARSSFPERMRKIDPLKRGGFARARHGVHAVLRVDVPLDAPILGAPNDMAGAGFAASMSRKACHKGQDAAPNC